MKIYENKALCYKAAENVCKLYNLPITEIQEGSYKGGLYESLFIVAQENGILKTLFEGAY